MGDGNDFGWGLIVMLPFTLYLMVGRGPFSPAPFGAVGLLFNLVGIIGTESRGAHDRARRLHAAVLGDRRQAQVAVRRRGRRRGHRGAAAGAAGLLRAHEHAEELSRTTTPPRAACAPGARRARWRWTIRSASAPTTSTRPTAGSTFRRTPRAGPRTAGCRRTAATSRSSPSTGYPGLILFLSILFITARDNVLSARRLRRAEGAAVFEPEWPLLLNVALLGYAICALFLGGITYPHLYLLAGLTVATTRVSLRAEAAPAGAGAALPRDAAPADPRARPDATAPRGRRCSRARPPAPAASSEPDAGDDRAGRVLGVDGRAGLRLLRLSAAAARAGPAPPGRRPARRTRRLAVRRPADPGAQRARQHRGQAGQRRRPRVPGAPPRLLHLRRIDRRHQRVHRGARRCAAPRSSRSAAATARPGR